MEKLTYESLPPSAQQSYNFHANIRKLLMFLGWGVAALLEVMSIIDLIRGEGDIQMLLYGSILIGGILLGAAHSVHYVINTFKTCMRIIPLFPADLVISFIAASFVWIAFCMASGVLLIIDTILFICKKPLIYPFEMKHFLQSKAAQAEILASAANESYSEEVMKDLENLKSMLEKGLITQKEFDDKKAELLELI